MFVSDDLVLHLHNSQPGQPDPDSLEMLDMDPDSKDPELQHWKEGAKYFDSSETL